MEALGDVRSLLAGAALGAGAAVCALSGAAAPPAGKM